MTSESPTPRKALAELMRALNVATGVYHDVPALAEPRPAQPVPAFEPPVTVSPFDALVTNAELRLASRKLYYDGHYASAVEAAYKLVINAVKRKAGDPTDPKGTPLDGMNLMHHVFDKDKPLVKLNRMKTQSDRDEQEGYRFIFAGVAHGVRNPRAHSHSKEDQPSTALELIVFANHLLAMLDKATRTRAKGVKKAATP